MTEPTGLPDIELTSAARWRKLALSVLALGAVHGTQIAAKTEMSWPLAVADAIIVLAFVASDVLDKALQTGALGKLGK